MESEEAVVVLGDKGPVLVPEHEVGIEEVRLKLDVVWARLVDDHPVGVAPPVVQLKPLEKLLALDLRVGLLDDALHRFSDPHVQQVVPVLDCPDHTQVHNGEKHHHPSSQGP